MYESKYFHKGIPLTEYCKDNNINADTIRVRIWKKKQDKKYENYTEQEIVDMVIESYGSGIKYMYKEIPLTKYCKDNGININTINARINRLKKKNENLSNDELVVLAIEEFNNQKFRFFYKGIPLIEYCQSHPELKYSSIKAYINREKEKNPGLSDEELLQQYLNREHKGIYKYYYLGIPLKQYCDENNLSHKNIITYINKNRNLDRFKNLSDDEFIEAFMKKYQPFEPKYLYKGQTLREYCIQNDLSYGGVMSFVKRKLAEESTKSIDDLIEEGVKTINRYGIVYYYNGIPLKECCNILGLNYTTVRPRIYEYANNNDISIDEAIKQIIDYYIDNPPVKLKYYFDDQSLRKFCEKNGYSYRAILNRIKVIESKNDSLDSKQVIEMAIKKYEDKMEKGKINEIFNKLKSEKVNSINEIENICNLLKIDIANVNYLVNMNFSYSQAINMIWYFFDKKTNDDNKVITDNKIREVLLLINKLKESNNIEEFELYDLIGIYKSGLYDSRNEILLRQKRYINNTIFSLCKIYEVEVNNINYEDFKSEIKYYLLMVINRININVYGQIIKYMDLTIKGNFRKYLKKYRQQNKCLSLDIPKYSDDKKLEIDYITNNDDPYENIENTSFSSDMMKALSLLSPEDLSFIMLKYQENYSDYELANHFNLKVDEIKKKEIEILSFLKNNDSVKVLRKKR